MGLVYVLEVQLSKLSRQPSVPPFHDQLFGSLPSGQVSPPYPCRRTVGACRFSAERYVPSAGAVGAAVRAAPQRLGCRSVGGTVHKPLALGMGARGRLGGVARVAGGGTVVQAPSAGRAAAARPAGIIPLQEDCTAMRPAPPARGLGGKGNSVYVAAPGRRPAEGPAEERRKVPRAPGGN